MNNIQTLKYKFILWKHKKRTARITNQYIADCVNSN